jgi:gluconokinase
MPIVPGLRSPYAKVGRLVYFGRMLDKIRLHAAGRLPPDYVGNLGDSKPGVFDTRCCGFLRVGFEDIRRRTLEEGSDEAVLEWVEQRGGRRSDSECSVWNCFMAKRGWHDRAEVGQRLRQRIAESGLGSRQIETFFDYIDYDEGRDPVATRAWETVGSD